MEHHPVLDVFNTEAHPFKVAPGSPDITYGSGSPVIPLQPFTTVPGDLPAVSVIAAAPGLVFGPSGISAKFLGIN
jgi:hypothetical protein